MRGPFRWRLKWAVVVFTSFHKWSGNVYLNGTLGSGGTSPWETYLSSSESTTEKSHIASSSLKSLPLHHETKEILVLPILSPAEAHRHQILEELELHNVEGNTHSSPAQKLSW